MTLQRDPRLRPWRSWRRTLAGVAGRSRRDAPVTCNICGWSGEDFIGERHSESAGCPGCGSIARDRFLYHCWTSRTPYDASAKVLETSPRMGTPYRRHMARLVDYLCSDYDLSSHVAMVQLDLQALDLPDESLDVLLTPHVLEHVPDTGKALAEIWRVLKPGGVMYLMVPLVQGRTAPPARPEYHADQTLVFWRFGWDLVHQLRAVGFDTTILVTSRLREMVAAGASSDYVRPELDERSLLAEALPYLDDMVAVSDAASTARLGFDAATLLQVWEARKPAGR